MNGEKYQIWRTTFAKVLQSGRDGNLSENLPDTTGIKLTLYKPDSKEEIISMVSLNDLLEIRIVIFLIWIGISTQV